MYSPNFELLYSDPSWRTTWTHIVPGRFSSSPYTCLLFFIRPRRCATMSGYGEMYHVDESARSGGGLDVGPLRSAAERIVGFKCRRNDMTLAIRFVNLRVACGLLTGQHQRRVSKSLRQRFCW
jgi:hypothetical protein